MKARLGTKYRDIADGNKKGHYPSPSSTKLGTKYRDIADGNVQDAGIAPEILLVGNQVPRYSGWKLQVGVFLPVSRYPVGNQVPGYSR